jgi:hypothetical protein
MEDGGVVEDQREEKKKEMERGIFLNAIVEIRKNNKNARGD